MKARIDEAFSAVQGGADFARVVQKHSDDTEAPTPDGRYTFGREVAVQPFDMLSHTGRTGELRGPFLTKYGYHFLEVVEYERGEQPAEDRTTVRHVLVMYPAMAEEGVDARELIRQRVAACRIEVLEPALANVVPPALRANVVR
jgi:parvulin-like peptidyl-prolyl isomerase